MNPGIHRAIALVLMITGIARAAAPDLEAIFRHPPPSARPWVLWHWIQGAVSKEGITQDLEAMKAGGIGGAYLMAIRDASHPPVFTPAVRTLTPEWWDLLRHAFAEADRLGLKLGLHVCDGFATAGGPWITPELSMQKVVWSETVVEGGRHSQMDLAQPPTKENHYRDIAVLALPLPEGWGVDTRTVVPKVTTSLPDIDAQFLVGPPGEKQIRTTDPCWIQYAFHEPFTLRSVVIRNWPRNYGGLYHATRLKIEASDDGKNFRHHFRLTPPRHGWQDWDEDYTFSIPEVTARFFRLVHDPEGAEEGSEDLNGAKWRPRLILRGLELSSMARIDNFEGKSGAVWRRAGGFGRVPLAERALVRAVQVIDVSDRMEPAGRLDWMAPAGRWLVLRLGHTSTGHRNETAGAGQGLEVDKFNPAAVRLQFDHWFGESVRQVGPDLAGRVLQHLLVDSWEGGSQNWTPAFRDEFKARRGYDPLLLLPVMAGIPIGDGNNGAAEDFLRDIRQTIADLLDDHFFGTLAELARRQGVEVSAEATAPTMMGDGMRHFGRVDVPMGEFWLRSPTHDKPNDILDAVSGAHVYGKKIVQAEAFTELGIRWDEHPGMLKPLADEHFALGINRLVFHVFAHNPWTDRKPGMTLDRVGLFFQRDQTWWPEVKAWTDYIARCSALLQAGRPVADVAYFTGDDLPARAVLPRHRSMPLPDGFTADSINADALVRRARVENGRLILPGGASYAALVLPTSQMPSPAVMRIAGELVRAGGVLAGPGSPPLEQQLERAGVEVDFFWADGKDSPADQVAWTHRTLPGAEIYFVVNRRSKPVEIDVDLRTNLRPEIWDPMTGEINRRVRHSHQEEEEHRTALTLRLEPHGSRFLVFREKGPPAGSDGHNWRTLRPGAEVPGPWTVAFDPALGGPREPVVLDGLADWSVRPEPCIRHYSGAATYTTELMWDPPHPGRRAWLDLGTVHNLARVTVNGVDCGVAWADPKRVEITGALRSGRNAVEIRVTNTWANRILGDADLPEQERVTWTAVPAGTRPEKLLPAGLLGPVWVLMEDDE